MRGLRDSGYAYGFYSYTNGWQEIVGSGRLPGVPVWGLFVLSSLVALLGPPFEAARGATVPEVLPAPPRLRTYWPHWNRATPTPASGQRST